MAFLTNAQLALLNDLARTGDLFPAGIRDALDGLQALYVPPVSVLSASVGSEASNKIPVSAHMTTPIGTPVDEAFDALVEVFAPTNGKGTISVWAGGTGGTVLIDLNTAAKEHKCVVRSTDAGMLGLYITDDLAETCYVRITPVRNVGDPVAPVCLTLTFTA